jgi:hypothetical protein
MPEPATFLHNPSSATMAELGKKGDYLCWAPRLLNDAKLASAFESLP